MTENLHLKANITGEDELTSFLFSGYVGNCHASFSWTLPDPYIEKEKGWTGLSHRQTWQHITEVNPFLFLKTRPPWAVIAETFSANRQKQHYLPHHLPNLKLIQASHSGFPDLEQGGAITELR